MVSTRISQQQEDALHEIDEEEHYEEEENVEDVVVYPEGAQAVIWVTQGRTEHAAYLLKQESSTGRKYIKWMSNNLKEWIDKDVPVKEELVQGRRRGRGSSGRNEEDKVLARDSSEPKRHKGKSLSSSEVSSHKKSSQSSGGRNKRKAEEEKNSKERWTSNKRFKTCPHKRRRKTNDDNDDVVAQHRDDDEAEKSDPATVAAANRECKYSLGAKVRKVCLMCYAFFH
jgi:hypothetical protein